MLAKCFAGCNVWFGGRSHEKGFDKVAGGCFEGWVLFWWICRVEQVGSVLVWFGLGRKT